ncbi:MFS transporter [Candidatus Falkowbacteria bacterium]|nr:MFS transporter [Candidatus Falkowbacteria bacterium]
MLVSLRTPKTALLLTINTVYYLNFSALFFLTKSLFAYRGIGGVGLFFTIQTALMILIRLFASRLFDEIKKTLLVVWCYALTTIGYALLFGTYGLTLEVISALVLGLGMGVGPPALNALMYAVSEQRVKAVNSNLMVMALQAGNFLGPILGGLAVGMLGYSGFLAVGALACLGGMALVRRFIRRGFAVEPFS